MIGPADQHGNRSAIRLLGLVLIAIWFIVLALMAPYRFCHVDDLIVPHLLCEPNSLDKAASIAAGRDPRLVTGAGISLLGQDSVIVVTDKPKYNHFLVGLSAGITKMGLSEIKSFLSHVYPIRLLRPSSFSTYPLGATLMQGLLITDSQPYWLKVSISRWCNLFAAALGLVLLFNWLLKQTHNWLPLVILVGLLTNLELVLHSIHGAVYGFAFLAGVLVILTGHSILLNPARLSSAQVFRLGLASFISYQATYTSVILLILWGLFNFKLIRSQFSSYKVQVSTTYILGFGLIAYQLYRLAGNSLASRGINWNAGPANTFLFDTKQILFQTGFGGLITYWPRNLGYQVNLQFLSALGPFTTFEAIIAGLIMIGLFVSLLFVLKSLEDSDKATACTILIVLGIALFLVIAGKLTLSPTRHWLFYMPFLWASLLVVANRWLAVKWCAVLIFILNASFFTVKADELIASHKSPFSPEFVNGIAAKHNVDLIIAHNWTYDVTLMSQEIKVPQIMLNDGAAAWSTFRPFYSTFKKPKTILLISHRQERLTTYEAEKLKPLVDLTNWARGGNLPDGVIEIAHIQKNSATEVEALALTINGTNGVYLSVLRLP